MSKEKLSRQDVLLRIADYYMHASSNLHKIADALGEYGMLLRHRSDVEREIGCKIEEVKI